MDRYDKKKFALINFSHGVFSILFTHDDLVMQALVCLGMMIHNDLLWCFICEFKITSHS